MNHQCDGSALDCNKAIKEILRLENRWKKLEARINHAIKYPISGTPGEMSVAQHELEDVLQWMKELEEK